MAGLLLFFPLPPSFWRREFSGPGLRVCLRKSALNPQPFAGSWKLRRDAGVGQSRIGFGGMGFLLELGPPAEAFSARRRLLLRCQLCRELGILAESNGVTAPLKRAPREFRFC